MDKDGVMTEDSVDRSHPLSFGQQGIWFREQLAPGNLGYVDHAAYLLHGRLDVNALRTAFERVVARHDVLRSTFHTESSSVSRPTQVVQAAGGFVLPVVEVAPEPVDARSETVQSWALKLADEGFDIEAGPLLRAVLIQ